MEKSDMEKSAADTGSPSAKDMGDRQDSTGTTMHEAPLISQYKDNIVVWDAPDDPANPMNWPIHRKILVTMLFGSSTLSASFGSSIISSATKYIAKEYHVSTEVSTLTLSLFLLGYVPGPIIFGPLSDLFGRRNTVILPLFIYMCFTAATATAENLQTVMITRFFGGLFASAPVSIVGGALADMFDQRLRGIAVVFYALAVVAGPFIAPIIGSAVSEFKPLGWRWTEYISVIFTGLIIASDYFFVPETSGPVILSRKAAKLRLRTGNWALHGSLDEKEINGYTIVHTFISKPLQMIVTEPMVFFLTLYNGFAYGIVYLLFSAIPIIFEENRGWKPVPASLSFMAVMLGCFLAGAVNVVYITQHYWKYLDAHGGKAPPEQRLIPMMLGGVTLPVGFFIVGWTSKPSIFWFPSMIGLFLIGMSFILIFQAGINYLIDAYTKDSASAVAANTFIRSIFAAALPLVAQPLYHNLGIDWACTLLGCICVLLAFIPFVLTKYGPALRARSQYGSTPARPELIKKPSAKLCPEAHRVFSHDHSSLHHSV